MARIRRKVHNFDIFGGYSFYTPGVGGVFALLGMLLVGTLFGSAVTLLLTSIYGSEVATNYGTLVSYPLMFVFPMMYAGLKSKRNALFEPGYALDSNHFGRCGGFLCAVLASIGVLCAAFMTDSLSSLMPPMPEWLEDALRSMTNGKLWANLLCVSVFAPLFEEWLCRGMVLRGLLNAKRSDGSTLSSPFWAIVISAVFFAVIHGNPWQAIPAFILGCLFGYVYYRTGSLKLTMLMHCVNNTFAVIISRIDAFSEIESWTELLPAKTYWLLFAAFALMLVMIVREFSKIPLGSASGNCDPLESE